MERQEEHEVASNDTQEPDSQALTSRIKAEGAEEATASIITAATSSTTSDSIATAATAAATALPAPPAENNGPESECSPTLLPLGREQEKQLAAT